MKDNDLALIGYIDPGTGRVRPPTEQELAAYESSQPTENDITDAEIARALADKAKLDELTN